MATRARAAWIVRSLTSAISRVSATAMLIIWYLGLVAAGDVLAYLIGASTPSGAA